MAMYDVLRRIAIRPVRRAIALSAVVALSASASGPLPAGRDFGAKLTLEQTTPLRQVLAAPERFGEQPVLVKGRLTDVCTRKGCWTVLTDGDATVRVRFHDYGFFLPQDVLGADALVEGRATLRTLSEREARHLAAESRGGNPDAIEGPQRELGFVATGVRVLEETTE
jgi:hypothetical protein